MACFASAGSARGDALWCGAKVEDAIVPRLGARGSAVAASCVRGSGRREPGRRRSRAVVRARSARLRKVDVVPCAAETARTARGGSGREKSAECAEATGDSLYACPRCRAPLGAGITGPDLAARMSRCSTCGAKFSAVRGMDGVPDLTQAAARNSDMVSLLRVRAPARQELFRLPLVSWLYERGWRDQFATLGFPGPEEEFKLVLKWFRENAAMAVDAGQGAHTEDALLSGVALDLSCGSGLMARRMLRSKIFRDKLVALDYSEAMVRETATRFDAPNEKRGSGGAYIELADAERSAVRQLDLIRGDASRLPFSANAVRWIHSGAAMHCWPVVQDALSECYRVLEPGGAIFATTVLWPPGVGRRGAPLDTRLFDLAELERLFRAAGFSHATVERRRRCAIIRASKPLAT